MEKAKVAILMGSKSDVVKIQPAIDLLKEWSIPFRVHVMSAHRTPDAVADFTTSAADNGIKVIIAAAGCAAHLAGVVAAHTILPVIGIPVQGGALNGLDALLSTVQMPGGIPVATVAIGSGGAKNAALLAAQIIALNDDKIKDQLIQHRKNQAAEVKASDQELQKQLNLDQ